MDWSTGNNIEWQLGDQNSDVYNITKNGTLFISDTNWSNNTISIDIDGLSIGVHNLTIYVFDTYGNMNSDSVIVTIVELKTTSSDPTTTSDTGTTTGSTDTSDTKNTSETSTVKDKNEDTENTTEEGGSFFSSINGYTFFLALLAFTVTIIIRNKRTK